MCVVGQVRIGGVQKEEERVWEKDRHRVCISVSFNNVMQDIDKFTIISVILKGLYHEIF